jgi:hypothetical protein
MGNTERVEIELRGVQIVLLDEPHDAQVWVSLAGYDLPGGCEAFCWAGGDTRAEAIAEAVRLFRDAADRLVALGSATSMDARLTQADQGKAIGSAT